MPLSSTDRPGQLVRAPLEQLGEANEDVAAPRTASTSRHVSNAVVCRGAPHRPRRLGPASGTGPCTSPVAGIHVLVHAPSARSCVARPRCAGAPRERCDRSPCTLPSRSADRLEPLDLDNKSLDLTPSSWSCQPMTAAELFDLSGKVAVITGGAGGIGVVYAEALCEAGASVVVADLERRRRREGRGRAGRRRATRRSAPLWTSAPPSPRRPWPTPRSTPSEASTSSSTTQRS